MNNFKTILLVSLFFLSGCWPGNRDYNFEYEIIISDFPENLENLNTVYNDYNSDLPYPAARSTIFFSSDRSSAGANFDIICESIDMSYHEKDNILNFSIPSNNVLSTYESRLIELVNLQSNEYGPYTFHGDKGRDYFFYANDDAGNYDIKFIHTPRLDWGTYDGQERLFGPEDVVIINSDHDDLYPVINSDYSRLFFCSNRENAHFDIYGIDLNNEVALYEYLTGTGFVQVTKESILSSSSNDKCPSIRGDLLVFASDREGGYGGYDLYYSLLQDNQWSIPVNFGNKINTAANEYRPITFSFLDFNLMIFSSDRSEGKGGYDLYCVKIDDI
ncbi:MAG: PD40 domain-containing protein [Deltaproteobacteria bacterium]|nr:PD40 domain-containing protein [Deltaproteobacteria bacterium]